MRAVFVNASSLTFIPLDFRRVWPPGLLRHGHKGSCPIYRHGRYNPETPRIASEGLGFSHGGFLRLWILACPFPPRPNNPLQDILTVITETDPCAGPRHRDPLPGPEFGLPAGPADLFVVSQHLSPLWRLLECGALFLMWILLWSSSFQGPSRLLSTPCKHTSRTQCDQRFPCPPMNAILGQFEPTENIKLRSPERLILGPTRTKPFRGLVRFSKNPAGYSEFSIAPLHCPVLPGTSSYTNLRPEEILRCG